MRWLDIGVLCEVISNEFTFETITLTNVCVRGLGCNPFLLTSLECGGYFPEQKFLIQNMGSVYFK